MSYHLSAPNIGMAWLSLLDNLVRQGSDVKPRGLGCREICGASIRVSDMRQNILVHPRRKLNYRFLVVEWLWIALGRDDLAPLARYNKEMTRFSDDGLTLAGAYGPRLAPHWQGLLLKLRTDPNTRQAVVSIWTNSPRESKDIPCTLSMQFLLRGGDLNCVVTMRSSDVWLGLPYDFFTFSMLTNSLAGALGVTPGWLQINMGSSHLYDEHHDQAREVLGDYTSTETVMSPSLPGEPPANLGLLLDEKMIALTLEKPWGSYGRCLNADGSAGAMEILRAISPKGS